MRWKKKIYMKIWNHYELAIANSSDHHHNTIAKPSHIYLLPLISLLFVMHLHRRPHCIASTCNLCAFCWCFDLLSSCPGHMHRAPRRVTGSVSHRDRAKQNVLVLVKVDPLLVTNRPVASIKSLENIQVENFMAKLFAMSFVTSWTCLLVLHARLTHSHTNAATFIARISKNYKSLKANSLLS